MRNLIASMCIIFSIVSMAFAGGKDSDKQLIDKVAQWQIKHHPSFKHHLLDWTNGALYKGLVEWAYFTGNETYFAYLKNIGDRYHWSFLGRLYHADDFCVGQTYLRLYEKYHRPEMITGVINRADSILANPSSAPVWFGAPKGQERWSWCDALFMSPTVFVKLYALTGDRKYLDFVNREFKITTDSLYDASEQLYYRDRRYISQREKNGAKVFWARGNGWVFAGLAIILQELSPKDASYSYYLDIYKAMAPKIVACQDKAGSWRASMLDPESYSAPENSSSAFFVYGLAWGINRGVLSGKDYQRAVNKGWRALKSYVHASGKLGYVQPIGAAPDHVTYDMTEVYGVGAFLLAGTEIMKMK